MKLTLERQIRFVFAISIILLAVIVFFAFRSVKSLGEALKSEKHTFEVISHLDETRNLMVNAETGARGFLITTDETILEPYTQAQQQIGDSITRLQSLIADNPAQVPRAAQLRNLTGERLDGLKTIVALRRTQSLEQVRENRIFTHSRELMNETRGLLGAMENEERRLLEQREAETEDNLNNTRRMLYLASFAGILSLGLANFAIFREIGKRAAAENQIKETNRDLERRVEERTGELSKSNQDLIAEAKRREESEGEREELLKREQAARKDAEIANRLRDEFLATVSHELRAPLNSILGWARLLEKKQLDETTAEKAYSTIVRNAESQNRLIEDLLDVSRIISGKLRLEVMTIKPINVVESALETVRPAAEAKGITIEIKGEKDISHISGDPNRLQQVVWNLLSNAIKFTPNDGTVRLEIEREEDFVEIRVKDTGVGIKEEFLPHVFDRFRQADASSIRKFGGLGLGLAIVRHITEMHGGTVHAFSGGENKGSTFVVRLPLTASTGDEEAEIKNKVGALEEEPEWNLDGMLILVVDDEEDTRQLLVQSLTFYGATVITANSAETAFDELQEKHPDVMVSDIGMPDEDGYSLIRRIRALPDKQHRDIPAIALTAFTRAQDRMKALTSGYQNHVAKPVEPDELATVIASLTGRLQK